MKTPIYLDNHATTPMDQRVFEKMRPFFLQHFGNPSSKDHAFGFRAKMAVDEARIGIARVINAHPTEIIFTSGATESINTVIKGLFADGGNAGQHREVLSSTIEHSATIEAIESIHETKGVQTSWVKPRQDGHIHRDDVLSQLTEQTSLVSLFMVNNEIGSITDSQAIGHGLKQRNILFHGDGAQALGRIPIDCQELPIDCMSFSGHKIYGPKGVGFLFIRRHVQQKLYPLLHGGGQEWGLRSGTLNVPGIVGLYEAVRLCREGFLEEHERVRSLRDNLWKNLQVLDGVHLNGALAGRVVGNLNVSFEGVDGEELVLELSKYMAISTASACRQSHGFSSRILKEIGVSKELQHASIRFGIGRFNTAEEMAVAADVVVKSVKALRAFRHRRLVSITRG